LSRHSNTAVEQDHTPVIRQYLGFKAEFPDKLLLFRMGDGMALAWACAFHLARETRAFTLFATHYFELTALPDQLEAARNVDFDAVEHGDRIIFLHAIKPGPANRSYGLQVAQLAGVPRTVIDIANERLRCMESSMSAGRPHAPPQPDLFRQRQALLEALTAVDPDDLTPRQALELLYRLRKLPD